MVELLNLINQTRAYIQSSKEGDLTSKYRMIANRFREKYSERDFIAWGGDLPIEEKSEVDDSISGRTKPKKSGKKPSEPVPPSIDTSNVPFPFFGPQFNVQPNMLTYNIEHVLYDPKKRQAEITVMYYYYFLMPIPMIAPKGVPSGASISRELPYVIHRTKNRLIWIVENGEWHYIPHKKQLILHAMSGAGATKWAPKRKDPHAYSGKRLADIFIIQIQNYSTGHHVDTGGLIDQFLRQSIFLNPIETLRTVRTVMPEKLPLAETFFRERIKEYEHVVKTYRKFPYFWKLLGQMYLQLGQTRNAIDAFLNVLDQEPSNIANLAQLSDLYFSMGNTDESMRMYHKYLDIRAYTGESEQFKFDYVIENRKYPKHLKIRNPFIQTKDTDSGTDNLHEINSRNILIPSPETVADTAYYALQRGLLADATRLFRAAYELSPEYSEIVPRIQSLRSGKVMEYKINELIPKSFQSLFTRIDPYDILLLLSRLGVSVEYPDITIGQTGFHPSANIIVRSMGYHIHNSNILGDKSEILINGTDVSPNKRGYNLIAFHPRKNIPEYTRHIDPFTNQRANSAIKEFFDETPDGYVVIGSIRNDGSANINLNTFREFRKIGGSGNPIKRFREAFIIIGVKGASPGTAFEKRGAAPMTTVILEANHPIPPPASSRNLPHPPEYFKGMIIKINGFGLNNTVRIRKQLRDKNFFPARKNS